MKADDEESKSDQEQNDADSLTVQKHMRIFEEIVSHSGIKPENRFRIA
jgi:hypothetical protein